MLTCRSLPAPRRFAIARAADESAYTTPLLSTPQSFIALRIPNSSAEHFTSAMSSASAELHVTLFCVLDQPLRKWPPIMRAPPLVDLPVTRHPAQSESEYPVTSRSCPCHSYFITVRRFSIRYLPNRFTLCQCIFVGLAIPRHSSFTAYIRSGLSAAK